MEEKNKLKMILISGAAHALKYMKENPKSTEQEVIRYITKEAENILKKIDEEI